MSTSTFTDALQVEVATLQAQHPILAGALDKAYALLVDGGVFPLPDGHTAHVRSQSDPTVSHLVNGTCDCKGAQYHAAPCAHRLAFRVYQRTVERLTVDPEDERWEPVVGPEEPAPQDGMTSTNAPMKSAAAEKTGLPEAPAPAAEGTTDTTTAPGGDSTPAPGKRGIPAHFLQQIQGQTFIKYAGLLQLAHNRGLQELRATWTLNAEALSLAHAIAVFPFGTFEECGDSTPESGRRVGVHWRRMSLTRAKARCLRDGLGIDVCSLEEME